MALSDNLRGAALMCAAMVAFTLNDTLMKSVTAGLPVIEAIAMRGTLTTLALALIGWRTGGLRLGWPAADRPWLAARAFGEVTSTFTFLLALPHMPIANLSAIMQCLPLAVTLAAALLLGDRIGWRRLTAILVGFAGVLLIVRPGTEGFDRWSVLGLVSVGCVVIRDLATRRISRAVPSATVAFLAALSVTLVAGLALPFTDRTAVDAQQAARILGAATCLIAGYLTVIMAMRVGDIAVVAPFRYVSLVAAMLLGWLAFGQFPDHLTLLGSAVVVATGIYTFHREHRLSRADAGAAPKAAAATGAE